MVTPLPSRASTCWPPPDTEPIRRAGGAGGAFFSADPEGAASPPSVVARAVAKVVTARRPRTRYAVGRGAKPILVARWRLPDRAFDQLMTTMMGVLARIAARQRRVAGNTA